ncbi:DUF58 domain-containing protein [Salinadaptatus halalkaliphilus]|uniref:DUF58 domain-containing protein n=1 Tax=Salinadaptatus halalkaliphilus TaxID=2419781 RepID=A0A4S3TN73_9EURY|nr:DUF58 domain-containing protein [Salinadaptatus halalkaliphilus]THE65749.1 DUF58 domain-containing protein [Salinadaptatus halalkaliphilus]
MRRVSRWHSGVVATIVLTTAGLLVGSRALLLAAIVPITYLGYGALSSIPDPTDALSVERECSPRRPLPGERVAVTLTVRNEGRRTLPDVRIVDGVPDELEVVEGSPRAGATLRAGQETTLSYTLQPRRGSYAFGDTRVRVRSLSATAVATAACPVTGDDDLECRVPVDGLPVERDTIAVAGAVATDSGGPGNEFHSTRDYQRGDPLNRVDWRRYARTGELGTVLYREQEAATVVVIVDGRQSARVAAAPGHPDGITLAAYAGVVTASALIDAGHTVGVVGLGVRGDVPGVYTGPPAYVEPGRGVDVGGRIARVCDAVAARATAADGVASSQPKSDCATGRSRQSDEGATARADGHGTADHLETLLPERAQLVVCTPAVDDEIVDLAIALRRRGYTLSTISPNVTGRDDAGARLAAIRRQSRLERLGRLDVPVSDWEPDTPLASALGRGFGEVIR